MEWDTQSNRMSQIPALWLFIPDIYEINKYTINILDTKYTRRSMEWDTERKPHETCSIVIFCIPEELQILKFHN